MKYLFILNTRGMRGVPAEILILNTGGMRPSKVKVNVKK